MFVRVSNNVRKKLIEFSEDDESYDASLTRLFTMVDGQVYEYDENSTGIRVSDENYKKLESFRAYSTEPFSSVLLRLLESVEKK